MEGDTVIMQDIFQFVQTTVENGKVLNTIHPDWRAPEVLQPI